MNLPIAHGIAQKRAQKTAPVFSISRGAIPRAIVCLPALVPSFKRAGGNVTCYPSPSERPVGIDGGPSFFKGGSRHLKKEREEARATCRNSNLSRLAQSRPWACRAVLPRPTLTAQPSGPPLARSGQQLSGAVSLLASLLGPLLARLATKCLRSATDLNHTGPASARPISVQTGPFGAFRPVRSFFVSTPAVTAPA